MDTGDIPSLAPTRPPRYSTRMTDPKPIGPFTLTPIRIAILAFGVLAIIYILGATLFGGVSGLNDLRTARDAALVSSEASAASSEP